MLEMVTAFEKASGKVTNTELSEIRISLECFCVIKMVTHLQKIPIKLCPRRLGDATAVYASTEKAEKELGWK